MFEIVENKGQIYINLTRNDSCEISTIPYVDTDENKIFDIENNDKPIILGDDDYILFCVSNSSGRIYLKKKLTNKDYNSDGILTMKLCPEDTIDLQPFSYLFSFSYMPHNGEDCYTYASGIFNLLPAVGTIRDLNDEIVSNESGGVYDN